MNAQWQQARSRFAALAQRERLAVTIAIITVVLFGVWRGVVQPAGQKAEAAQKAMAQTQANLAKIHSERQQLEASLTLDPNEQPRAELKSLEATNSLLRQRLVQGNTAVATTQMLASALRAALSESPGVRLVSVNAATEDAPLAAAPAAATTPASATPTAATPAVAAAPSAKMAGLYRQKLTVILHGSYPDLSRYIAALEEKAPAVAWNRLALKVEAWPRATLTLELSTLSLEKTWLGY